MPTLMNIDPENPDAPDEWIEDEYFEERDKTCPHCGGSGQDPIESFMPCPHCDGEGYQWWLT